MKLWHKVVFAFSLRSPDHKRNTVKHRETSTAMTVVGWLRLLYGTARNPNGRRFETQANNGKVCAVLKAMKSAVFIERDGILNHARVIGHHQVSPLILDEFHIHTEVAPLLHELRAAGLVLVVTTNQPGLSRGYQSRRELDRMHTLLRATLPVDDILVCPHDEMDDCGCRKPKPGLLVEAAYKWHLRMSRCFVISDKWQDAEAARMAGCDSVLLQSPWLGSGHHDYVLPDLAAVVDKILRLKGAECGLVA